MTPERLKFTRSTNPRQQILMSIQDVVRIEVSCDSCGTTLSLDTATKKTSLARETCCPECKQPLWKGGDDTRFPRALLDAIFTGDNRFKFLVRTRENVAEAERALPKTA